MLVELVHAAIMLSVKPTTGYDFISQKRHGSTYQNIKLAAGNNDALQLIGIPYNRGEEQQSLWNGIT